MQRRDNLAHFLLVIVVLLGLTLLTIDIDAQAQIAFASNREGNHEIYVMHLDGKNQRRLTNHPNNDSSPSWSPDGKRIVFISNRDGHVHVQGWPTYEIYMMDADGGNQQNLSNDPNDDREPSWSPDGKRIVFTSERDGQVRDGVPTDEIYVMDANGDTQQRLTNDRNNDGSPSWSPDGKRIVFSSERDGHFENDFGTSYEIYVMDADGGNQQRLTENRRNDWDPSWSPDGKRIAFASDRKGDFVNSDIYVMDADGQNEQRLTENRVDDSSPSWSPDSERIAFGSQMDGNFEIYAMDADGGNLQNLTNHPGGDFGPAWLNSPFLVSPVGKKFTMWGRLKRANR